MSKFWHTPAKVAAIVIAWFAALVAISAYVSRSSITPAFPYYQSDLSQYPQFIRPFAHFDGIHYLRIAEYGYQDVGTQAFFPLYPLLIRFLSPIFPAPLYVGILVSLVSLVIAILGLHKLFPKILHTKYLLLLLPTSFFFASVYTESLFFALTIWFFVLLKQKSWALAAILAGLAGATRPIGIFLTLSLIYELIKAKKYWLLTLSVVSTSGFLAYCFYLFRSFGDPLMFFHVQPLFGAERSGSSLILLPQVLYRYLKMMMTVSPLTFVYQRIWLELLSFLGIAYLIIKHFHRLSLSHLLFLVPSLLLPTLTGTLSSFPRYALLLLPWLLPSSINTSKYSLFYILVSSILLVYLFTIFASGVFVS